MVQNEDGRKKNCKLRQRKGCQEMTADKLRLVGVGVVGSA